MPNRDSVASSFSAIDANGPTRSPCWRASSMSSRTLISASATDATPRSRAVSASAFDRFTYAEYCCSRLK
jgi:hypothetical protein